MQYFSSICKFAVGIISLTCATSIFADSFWTHNGSVMRLQHYGKQRIMSYEIPSDRMSGVGVESGTLYFNGVRDGNMYYGTARRFSKYCYGAIEYRVSGRVINERKIVLSGHYPEYVAGCYATGKMVRDVLEFTYMSSDTGYDY